MGAIRGQAIECSDVLEGVEVFVYVLFLLAQG